MQIDGKPTKGQSMTEAVDSMRGKAGSPITLTIVRDGGRPFDVELKRAIIKVKSVKSQVQNPATPTCASPSSRSTPARKWSRR